MSEKIIGNIVLTELRTLFSNTYAEVAPSNHTWPYAIFKLTPMVMGENNFSTIDLTIDVWDNKGDNISDLIDTADKFVKLHNNVSLEPSAVLSYRLNSKVTIDDPDFHIRRRQLNFIIQHYPKEV